MSYGEGCNGNTENSRNHEEDEYVSEVPCRIEPELAITWRLYVFSVCLSSTKIDLKVLY